MADKTPVPDVARFKTYKGRITDFLDHNADKVRAKVTLMTTATIFAEMQWLCQETRRFGFEAVDDKERFGKVEKFVARVCEEQAASVAGGIFVKVRADIFSAYRFLVRACEAAYKHTLDVEDALAMGPRLPEVHQERISLDLEDGLGDAEDEAPAEAEPVKKNGRKKQMVPPDDDVPGE